jgi:hypothetical protein
MSIGSLTNAVCLEGGDFGGERFNLAIEALHLRSELLHTRSERVFARTVFNQAPHCIAGEIGDAASAGGLAESAKCGVLIFGEPDTDHAGAWF